MSLAKVVDGVLVRSPAQRIAWERSAQTVTILAYHDVKDQENFARQISFLSRECQPVSLGELILSHQGMLEIPKRAVLITFDDGNRSIMERGLPVLKLHSVPAVVFVVADRLENEQPLWWEEVEQLIGAGGTIPEFPSRSAKETIQQLKRIPNSHRLRALDFLRESVPDIRAHSSHINTEELVMLYRAGLAIGNHTLTHPCLDQCSTKEVRREIEKAHSILADILTKPTKAFAYPNGNWDARAEQVLADLDYEAGFLFDHRLTHRSGTNPLRLSRLRVDSTTSLDRFRLILSGLHPSLHRVLGRT